MIGEGRRTKIVLLILGIIVNFLVLKMFMDRLFEIAEVMCGMMATLYYMDRSRRK